jgi:hypothetical protein
LSHTEQVSIDGVFLPTFHFSSLFRCTSLKDTEFSLLMNRLITSSQTSSAIYECHLRATARATPDKSGRAGVAFLAAGKLEVA